MFQTKSNSLEIRFGSALVITNGLVPLALMIWDGYFHRLGANPLEFITRTTGTLTLIFLLLTLSITPLRKLFNLNWLGRYRRLLGLYAFFYGLLHLLAYVWFDKFFDLRAIVTDVVERRFVIVGMMAFFLMVPLAVTSTNAMIRRLGGRRWNRLHKLTYAVATLGVLHYYLLVKADTRKPLAYGAVLALLLAYRLIVAYLKPAPGAKVQVAPRT